MAFICSFREMMRVASFAFVQHLFGFQYIIPGALVLGVYLLDLFPFRYGFIQITLHGKSDTEVVTGLQNLQGPVQSLF